MPRTGRPKAVLELADAEREQLLGWEAGHDSSPALALRSRIVLQSASGLSNKAVADAVGVSPATVGKWRSRFCELRLDGLADGPRPGRPASRRVDRVEAVPVAPAESTSSRRAPEPGQTERPSPLPDEPSPLPGDFFNELIVRDTRASIAPTRQPADARPAEPPGPQPAEPPVAQAAEPTVARPAEPPVAGPAEPPVDEHPTAPGSGIEDEPPEEEDHPRAADASAQAGSASAPDEAAAVVAEELPESARRTPRRRRGLWVAIGAVVVLGVVQLIAILSSGGGGHHRALASAPVTTTTASTTPRTSKPRVPPTAAGPSTSQTFSALPGGVTRARGSAVLVGSGDDRTLELRVQGLPIAKHGHYEVYLYDSILDSQSLGAMSAPSGHLTVRLPSDARDYRWIDISLQPVGSVSDSGASVLRAANPAR